MKLSIITINLNNKDGLRKTIESVVNQTFDDYEYLVIDGASTDGSLDVIKEYADKISYWVSEPDKGIYNAMNKGILKAKGEYCLFLNSGDWLVDSDILKKVLDLNLTADILNGNMLKLFSEDNTILDKGQAYIRLEQGRSLSLEDMLKGTINHSSSFIKRNLFDKYGLYREDYKIVSDWIFFLQTIGLNDVKVKYIDLIISVFDMTGISNTESAVLSQERKRAIDEYVPKSILDDYDHFHSLEKKYNYIFRYRFTYRVACITNKIIGVSKRWIFFSR